MDSKILNNLKSLNNLNRERVFWLRMSAFVVIVSLLTVFNWTFLIKNNLIWLIGGGGILIAVIWWYWTMSIIRKLIGFKTVETEIMSELISDIKDIKQDVRKNFTQNT